MPSSVRLDLPPKKKKKKKFVVVQMLLNLKFCIKFYEVLDFPIPSLVVGEQDKEFRRTVQSEMNVMEKKTKKIYLSLNLYNFSIIYFKLYIPYLIFYI
jgi:hypothetical protein